MSLRVAYVTALAVTLVLAMLGVLLGGELPLGSWIAIVAPPVAAYLRTRRRALPGIAGTTIAAAALLVGASSIAVEGIGAAIRGGAIAVLGILVGRCLSARTLAHDLQSLALGLLLIFSGTVLHNEISYGLVFVGFAIAGTLTLVSRQLVQGAMEHTLEATLARRDIVTPRFAAVTSLLAVVILASTSLLFILFPRMGFANLGLFAQNTGGFPYDVSLAGSPRAAGGGAVAARIRGIPYDLFEDGLYLRGPVYDTLTERGFTQTEAPESLPIVQQAPAPSGVVRSYDVFVEPLLGALLPALGGVQRAYVLGGGANNPNLRTAILGSRAGGQLYASRPLTGPLRYAVTGEVTAPGRYVAGAERLPTDPAATARMTAFYTRLPDGLDPRIPTLARRLLTEAGVAEGDNAAIAAVLRRYLLGNHTYTLAQPNGDAPDPLAAFLFDDRRGHCEYFATAHAAMLRASGVPSRVVGGFQGGAWAGDRDDPEAVIVFLQRNAHAWVEWYSPGIGWVTDDPTPAASTPPALLEGLSAWIETMSRAWDDYVVDYSARQQVEIFQSAVRAVGSPWQRLDEWASWRSFGAFALCLAVAFALWRLAARRRRRGDAIGALCAALLAYIEGRTGEPVPAATTLREAVSALDEHLPERALLTDALQAYERERFGAAPLSGAHTAALVARLERHAREARRQQR